MLARGKMQGGASDFKKKRPDADHIEPDGLFWVNFAAEKETRDMKKTHIILLVAVAAMIAGLLSMMKDLSTYDTIASARNKDGRYVHLIARLDKNEPVVYDPVKDPNHMSFFALDSLGGRTRVVYRNSKPTDFEHSERIVLKGRMKGEVFECEEMLLKCPSKYKEGPSLDVPAGGTLNDVRVSETYKTTEPR